jgi:hypothetical protein
MSKHANDDLTLEYLHSILTYDSDTGDFYWKPRPREWFNSDRVWNSFNARFANKKVTQKPRLISPNYLQQSINLLGRNRTASRIAWFMHYGEWPEHTIDHINGDSTDNRIENLRDVSHKENSRNMARFSTNTTGVAGVSITKYGKFKARIKADGESIHLGNYETLEEAAAARKEAEIKYGFHENHGRERANAEGE